MIAEDLKKLEVECGKASLPLKSDSLNLVFGKGNPEAKIMFIGEGPGKNEDLQGMPFVGAAGKNLDKLLERVGLSLDDVYIANILKYRPPENRDPKPEEIVEHGKWLVKQIEIIKPRVVCSLGNYSTKFLLAGGDVSLMKIQDGITKLHGKVRRIKFNGADVTLIPLFHPAAIIYNRGLLTEWEKDMEIVKSTISAEKEQKKLF